MKKSQLRHIIKEIIKEYEPEKIPLSQYTSADAKEIEKTAAAGGFQVSKQQSEAIDVFLDKIKKLGDSSLEKDFRKIIVRTFQDQKMNIEK